jgi:glycosyltransferase involved in cell wall biosynthesis
MKFSLVIVALNEEKYLADCIKSVPNCDDIVVLIDTRTTDKTAEIAKANGARVFERTFDGFASQKNYAIDLARHDWVLILDGDERLMPDLAAYITTLELDPEFVAYSFRWRNYVGKKWLAHGGYYPDPHTRLVDRRHAQYGKREVHETLEIDGKTKALNLDVIHLTYPNFRAYYRKVMKYAREEARWSKERPSLQSIVKEFAIRYLKLAGYKDGWQGLISAYLMAYYRLVVRWNMKAS